MMRLAALAAALAGAASGAPRAWGTEASPEASNEASSAQPEQPVASAEAEAQAKAAYAAGADAFRLGRYPEAIQHFEDAYRLSHRVEILFNVGLANRKAYEIEKQPEYLRRALDIYRQFQRLASSESQREAARQSIKQLAGQLAALEEQERAQRLRSGGGPPQLQAALRLAADGKGPLALSQLEALLHAGKNSPGQLSDIYRTEGEIASETSQTDAAVDAFQRLLVLNPEFELPKTAPAASRGNLGRARRFWTDRTFAISPVVPPPAEPDQPLGLPILVENDLLSMVSRVVVRYRRSGDRRFSSISRTGSRAGAVEVSIPAVALPGEQTSYRMEYFVEALDADGNIIATVGGENAPLSFPVLTPEEAKKLNERGTPWYASWWFWTGASVVAVGAAFAIAAGAGAFSGGAPGTTLGNGPTLNSMGRQRLP